MAFTKIKSVIDGMARLTNPSKELQLGTVIKSSKENNSENDSDSDGGKKEKEKEPEDESSIDLLRYVIKNKFYSHRQTTFGFSIAVNAFDLVHVDGKPLPSDAKKLYEMGSPSPFGDLKTATTKLDDSVRKAREIDRTRLQLTEDGRRFIDNLGTRLASTNFVKRAGEDEKSAIQIQPYKMNIYGKTGHFKLHQDTPRKGVLASLVISFPYYRRGGDLVVQNGEFAFDDSAPSNDEMIRVSVFYSNCPHTVQPVIGGFRVTLACHVLAIPAPVCPIKQGKHMYDDDNHRCVLETVEEHEEYHVEYRGWQSDPFRDNTLWNIRGREWLIWAGIRVLHVYSQIFSRPMTDLWALIVDYVCGPTDVALYTQSNCVEFAADWESEMTAHEASSEGRVQLLAKSDDGEAAFVDAATRVLAEYKTFGVLLSCRYSYEELKIGLWKSADQRLLLSKACELLEVQMMPVLMRRQGEWPHDREDKPDDTVDTIFRMTSADFESGADLEYDELPRGAPDIPFFDMEADSQLIKKDEDSGAENTGNESRDQSCDNTYFQVAALFRSKVEPGRAKTKGKKRKMNAAVATPRDDE
jgi:hypothetical protein